MTAAEFVAWALAATVGALCAIGIAGFLVAVVASVRERWYDSVDSTTTDPEEHNHERDEVA